MDDEIGDSVVCSGVIGVQSDVVKRVASAGEARSAE
jgi:hypothetical protein